MSRHFCFAFLYLFASYLQQKPPVAPVETILSQGRYLKHVKKLGTAITYPLLQISSMYSLTLAVFSDASRTDKLDNVVFSSIINWTLTEELHFLCLNLAVA